MCPAISLTRKDADIEVCSPELEPELKHPISEDCFESHPRSQRLRYRAEVNPRVKQLTDVIQSLLCQCAYKVGTSCVTE